MLAPNADRRMWVVIAVYGALAVVYTTLVDLPLGITSTNWRPQSAMVLAFIVANVVMSVFRVDRGNALRRTNETLTEMVYVVGFFWLAPWPMVGARVVAAFIAWHFTKMRFQWRIYNAVIYLIITTSVVAAARWWAPASPLDGWKAVMVAVSVWFLNDLVRISAVFVLNWARFDRPRFDLLRMGLKTTHVRGIAAAFGLIVAISLAVTPWSLVAVAVVGSLFVIVSKANTRASSLDQGITEISRFSSATVNAQRPEKVEEELLNSVETFARLNTIAIARAVEATPAPSEAVDSTAATTESTGDGSVGIAWAGVIRPGIESTIDSPSSLSALADGAPRLTADRRGQVAAWLIDAKRESYLVVESSETAADQSDLWTTVGYLVDHARLAIETVYASGELAALATEEYERARRHPLTRLPNRVAIMSEMESRFADGRGDDFSLILLELTGYRELVNILGQDFANDAVCEFADRLLTITGVDYVAHIAAARFALLVSADEIAVRRIAQRACAASLDEATSTADPLAHRVAIAGVASSTTVVDQAESEAAAEQLMRSASIAIHSTDGDAPIGEFGSEDRERAERRISIRLRLGSAIDGGAITPHFQPQLSLVTGDVVGCEVLARWDDPQLGRVGPHEFITVAEQSGQIDRLTIALAEQAFDEARYWGGGDHDFDLSINLSARSIDRPGFLTTFQGLVDATGRSASSIVLEITESTIIDRGSTIQALTRLREQGFRISIDDFGTGYSALSYLDRLPVDEVKVDRSMVAQVSPEHPVSPVLVHLIELCQALGYTVVAEGIEDHYQRNVLGSLGCNVGQGYLLSRPLSGSATTNWLAAHRVDFSRQTPTFGEVDIGSISP